MSPTDAAPVAAEERVPALPDDVVSEILARVPDLVSLFRCAVACKRWLRLVSDPAFLRRRLSPDGSPPSLLGFFVQRHRLSVNARRKVSKLFPTSAPAFVPAPGSALGPRRRFLTSFVRDDGAGLLDEAKPLAARGGLLLVRVSPRPSDKNTTLRLCVCNLLTGRRDLIPPLDAAFFNSEGVQGYALLTAADHGAGSHRPADGYSTFFQVLLIGVARENRHLHLLKFSSATAASRIWCADNCRLHTAVHLWGPHGCCVAAIAGGAVHWLFRGNNPDALSLFTLDVSITTGHITATRLPFDALPHPFRVDLSNAWLCTVDARLSLFFIRNNRLMVLAQRDGAQAGTLVWRLAQFVQVGVDIGLFGIESLSPVCAGEKSGKVLVLYHSDPESVYVLNLQSGSATKVEGWTRSFNYMTVVPCEINWPMFFMSRFGVQL